MTRQSATLERAQRSQILWGHKTELTNRGYSQLCCSTLIVHWIILKRLLCTLSLNLPGNLEVGQEIKPHLIDDDTEAQSSHIFRSELSGKCYLHQRAEFTHRKKRRFSKAEEGSKRRQSVVSGWNKQEAVEPGHHSLRASFLYSKCSFQRYTSPRATGRSDSLWKT